MPFLLDEEHRGEATRGFSFCTNVAGLAASQSIFFFFLQYLQDKEMTIIHAHWAFKEPVHLLTQFELKQKRKKKKQNHNRTARS